MNVRAINGDDRSAWLRMRNILWPGVLDSHQKEIDEYFNDESVDIKDVFILENEENKAVGFLEINIRSFAEGSREPKVPYVEAWFVDFRYRGQGLGKQLMAYAEDWAKARGFSELASDTEIDNNTSINLHKKLGFVETERVVCFLKKLV